MRAEQNPEAWVAASPTRPLPERYTVNPDCTGTATLQFYESGQLVRTSELSLVFDNNEREIRMVQKSLQQPNGAFLPVVIIVQARRIFTEE